MERILERITGLLAAGSALVIMFSVSHELGYFTYIGSYFFQAFVTASDYFTNAILWLPIAIISIATWRNYKFLWNETPKVTPGEWRSWIVPALLLGGPILMLIFMSEGVTAFYCVGLIYLWFLFFDYIIPKADPNSVLSVDLRELFKIVTPVCAALFTLGYDHASGDLNIHAKSPYIVHLKDSQDALLRIPLRSFDKGVLFNDPVNGRIEFMRWEKIDSLVKPRELREREPISCILASIRCRTISLTP